MKLQVAVITCYFITEPDFKCTTNCSLLQVCLYRCVPGGQHETYILIVTREKMEQQTFFSNKVSTFDFLQLVMKLFCFLPNTCNPNVCCRTISLLGSLPYWTNTFRADIQQTHVKTLLHNYLHKNSKRFTYWLEWTNKNELFQRKSSSWCLLHYE